MSKDTLSEYGPNAPKSEVPGATSGGVTQAKPLPYSPPVGPKYDRENIGKSGTQK